MFKVGTTNRLRRASLQVAIDELTERERLYRAEAEMLDGSCQAGQATELIANAVDCADAICTIQEIIREMDK